MLISLLQPKRWVAGAEQFELIIAVPRLQMHPSEKLGRHQDRGGLSLFRHGIAQYTYCLKNPSTVTVMPEYLSPNLPALQLEDNV